MRMIPEHIAEIKEIKIITEITERIANELQSEIERLDSDIFIMASSEKSLKRREKILNIEPLDTELIDDRRFKVLINWYDTFPYTRNDLANRLDTILGKGEYSLEVNINDQVVRCWIELTSKKMQEPVTKLLDELVPLNMILEITLKYNQYFLLAEMTNDEMKSYNHTSLREDILKGVKNENYRKLRV